MTREIGLATKADLKRRKKWEDHIRDCKLKDCNHCQPHLWVKIKNIEKWVINHSQEGRQQKFYVNAQDLVDFLRK